MNLEPNEWLVSVVSFVGGIVGAYFTFRLKLERFFGAYEERERQKDQRWDELMERLDRIERVTRHRRLSD